MPVDETKFLQSATKISENLVPGKRSCGTAVERAVAGIPLRAKALTDLTQITASLDMSISCRAATIRHAQMIARALFRKAPGAAAIQLC